ncbi:ATP synthase F1 subunit delta [Winogradskyella pelagia]|nr:ATP synthase F1 subunit delta [Winogradskyella sp. DF17]
MSRAAIRYAKALLSLALDRKKADKVNDDMLSIANGINSSEELGEVLRNSIVRAEDKKNVIDKIFPNTNSLTKDLFGLLIQNNRFASLEEIANQYLVLYKEHNNEEVATVTTAIAMSKNMESKVLAKIKDLTDKAVTVENIIDESIIGGFILRVGDTQFDASISNKLSNLKREFTLN